MLASNNGGDVEIALSESLSAGEIKDGVTPLPDFHACPTSTPFQQGSPFSDRSADGAAPGTLLTPGLSRHPSISLRVGLPECQGLLVAFKDLTYTVKAKKETLTLLDSLTGFFKPGEMTALMGPSGSGKTTLLDVLAGRKTAGTTLGQVTYGNEPPTKAFLRRHTGYVEQFDTLVENMTVREMILYTAQMKLPHTMAKSDKVKATEEIMDRLGLSLARDTLIGGQSVKGISGGQAKRVNIAVSLITDPYVLYLDEPTSGLDSFTADEVMRFVKSSVSTGITICATIHSPSPKTFELFDSLGLLVRGRMVYFGRNLRPAIDYFYNQSLTQEPFVQGTDFPAEWLVTLVTAANKEGKEEIKRFSDTYERSLAPSVSKALEAEVAAVSGSDGEHTGIVAAATSADSRSKFATTTPVWWALLIYFKYRSFKNFKDPLFLSARIVDKLIVVSIVASLFHGQAHKGRDDCDIQKVMQASAFLFMWAATPMFSAAAYLPTFMLERALFRRERSDGIFNVVTYYAAKWIEEIIVAIPVTLVFSAIVYFAVGLAGNFFVFWIIWLFTVFSSIGLAFCFAMLSPTLDFANGSVPSYGGTLLYFMGYLISLKDIPVWWIWYSYIDFLRFTFVGFMTNEFKGYGTTIPINCNATVVVPVTADNILGTYGIYDETAYANLGFLCIFMVVFAGGALFLLKYLKYGSR